MRKTCDDAENERPLDRDQPVGNPREAVLDSLQALIEQLESFVKRIQANVDLGERLSTWSKRRSTSWKRFQPG
jgi:hypothetical protein